MTLDILCKVVDNYGDIGVVYRLARAISELEPEMELRLHVDDLGAFAALKPGIDGAAPVQRSGAWTILRWDIDLPSLMEVCKREPPTAIIECFACGRPPALEELLFDPERKDKRLVVNLEHLTAEAWADELHRMPSATRSALVRKVIFMPGFTPSTGGLIVDRSFRESMRRWRRPLDAAVGIQTVDVPNTTATVPNHTLLADTAGQGFREENAVLRRELAERSGLKLSPGDESRPWLLVFSYERDYARLVEDFAEAKPLVLVAAGRSALPFLAAWRAAGRPFPALELPFLPQELWDEFILASDLSLIRGEESLARAALAGRPFLWHAYRQEDNYQLVKVRALLERQRRCFLESGAREEEVEAYETLSLAFNDRLADGPEAGGREKFHAFLEALPSLRPGFESFAAELAANGNLASRLLDFIREERSR